MERASRVRRIVQTGRIVGTDQTVEFERTERERKPRIKRRAGFVMTWGDDLQGLGLNGTDYEILWALRHHIVPNTGAIRYTLDEVAAAIGASGPNARKIAWTAMNHLIKSGVVFKTGRGEITLNPRCMWTGDVESQNEAMLRFGILIKNGDDISG